MARNAALFLASLAVGLATLGFDASPTERAHVRAAEAIVAGGELSGVEHGIGFPLLIASAHALGGTKLVEILLAVIAALAFVLGAALARRLVPEPWATAGAGAVAVSAPVAAHAAAVLPQLTAGALLAGASILALRVRENPSTREALLAGLLIALLPWLGTRFLIAGLPILAAMAWWLVRRNRRLPAIFAAEVVAGSLIAFMSVNDALYERPTLPSDDDLANSPEQLLAAVRWAPVLVLVLVGAWLLWHSRRELLARAVPAVRDREAAAELLLLVCATQAAVAVFAAESGFPGGDLVAALPCAAALVAWGLRHHPRAGGALVALSLVATAGLLVDPASRSPWGPFVDGAALTALLVIVTSEVRGSRLK